MLKTLKNHALLRNLQVFPIFSIPPLAPTQTHTVSDRLIMVETMHKLLKHDIGSKLEIFPFSSDHSYSYKIEMLYINLKLIPFGSPYTPYPIVHVCPYIFWGGR